MKVEFSPEAMDDLDDIVRYIARDDPEAAVKWMDRLIDRAEKAGLAPRGAPMVPELKDPAIREVFLRTYRIIYRIEEERLWVLTVIEGHKRLRLR